MTLLGAACALWLLVPTAGAGVSPAEGRLTGAKAAVAAGSPSRSGREGEGGGVHRAGRSDAQRRAALDVDLAHVRDVAGLLARRFERARAARDALELMCLEEKVQRARSLLRAAHAAGAAARAETRPEGERDDLALVEVELVRARADAVRAQAEACLGEHAFAADGKTRVAVDRAGELAGAAEAKAQTPRAPSQGERRE